MQKRPHLRLRVPVTSALASSIYHIPDVKRLRFGGCFYHLKESRFGDGSYSSRRSRDSEMTPTVCLDALDANGERIIRKPTINGIV